MGKNGTPEFSVPKLGLYWPGKRTIVEKTVLPFQTVEVVNVPKSERENEPLFYGQNAQDKPAWRNKLIWGDNKLVMASLLKEFAGKIDLIYIDPPFATGVDFSFSVEVEGVECTKESSVIEDTAYRDTWGSGLDSYLNMLQHRLIMIRELLSETGSVLVHLDWHAQHYVKVLLDEIFGKENFRNEILTRRGQTKNLQSQFSSLRTMNVFNDSVLWYSRDPSSGFNAPMREAEEYQQEGRWQSMWNNADRPTMRYDLLGCSITSGQWKWSKVRALAAVQNYRDYLKAYENTGESLEDYWARTGSEKEFIRRNGNAKPQYWVPPSAEVICDNNWFDIKGYDYSYSYKTQKSESLLDRIIQMCSDKDELVADFFCGSGTTGVVAEKLGRRWIMCDLGKFAIHTTRKRLLDIPGCKPFEVLNLGNYEKAKLAENGIGKYIDFVLQLYRAERITGYKLLHGKKGKKMVHIGAIDSAVTEREVREVMQECAAAGAEYVDILGWDFEMGLHEIIETLRELVTQSKVVPKLIQIPREALEVRDAAKDEVKFFDLNHVELEHKLSGKALSVKLKDFVLCNTSYLSQEVRNKLNSTNYQALVDYWAIDFDYQGDVFHNMWQSFRTKKRKELELAAHHDYAEKGKKKVLVKVVDIFGNDTTRLLEVEVK